MDTEEGRHALHVLMLRLQKHIIGAQLALGERTRADFRADTQAQAAVIAELNSLHEYVEAIGTTLDFGPSGDQFLVAAGLETKGNVLGAGPNLKKVYNFVHQQLPDTEAVVQLELDRMQAAQEEEPDDKAGIPAEDGSGAHILVSDWSVSKPGVPGFDNVTDDNFIVGRPASFTSFDRRLHELEFWKELEKKTGERMPPAQRLVYQAIECEDDEKKIALLNRALATSPDCADAYILLAEKTMTTVEEMIEICRQALAAAERSLGPGGIKKTARRFWTDFRTRPYMRARAALAENLYDNQQYEEAFGHWSALLELNPDDHQGIREWLLFGLLDQRELDQAEALYRRFQDQPSGFWSWSRALLDFLKLGDSHTARSSLAVAKRVNPYVTDFLLERRRLPIPRPEAYTLGSEEEAIDYTDRADLGWHNATGAVEWVKSQGY